jgi:MoaA/NifB/PqqE/SkfB family radical SAM enzyme
MSTMARLEDLRDGVVTMAPQTLHIDVTNACNTNCVTCWDHSPHLDVARPTSWKKQKVDLASVTALLDDVQSLDTPRGGLQAVIVSGMGEPFTHPDIETILSDIKRRGLHLTVITNLVAADIERVVDIGVDALLVGVQGASEASYLAFHPNFSSWHWQRLQSQLAVLAASPSITHKQVQVICRHNAHELREMVSLAAKTSADQVNFKLASLKHGTEAVALSSSQRELLLLEGIAAAEEDAKHRGVRTNLRVFRAQLQRMHEGNGAAIDDVALETAPIDEVGCFLGGFYSRVTVDGTVLFCCNTEVEIGSLSVLPFSSWWRSARWEYWRRRMREGRYLESCSQCGKLNQNDKLSRRFRERFGDETWRAVTGRGAGRVPVVEAAPRIGRRGLPVLP